MSASRMPRRIGALGVLVLLVAACSSGGGGWPSMGGGSHAAGSPRASTSTAPKKVATPGPSQKRSQAPRQTGAAPDKTSAPVTVDKITVQYTYKDGLITPLAHLYGSELEDFAIVKITNGNSQPAKVVVTTEITGFTNKASSTVTIGAGKTEEIDQTPRLDSSAIDRLNAQKPADFHIRVVYLDNGQEREALDETQQTLVWGRRDFPWVIEGMSQQDVFELVAAMATPQDPAVEELIRAAAEYMPDKAMTSGYGGIEGDEKGSVWDRLQAIWDAESKDYSLTYISTPMTFAPGETQRIRLPTEVLQQHSGNCIELALLYASTVEALGMNPVLVLVPGHAYLGVRTDAKNSQYYFVETTMIGQATFEQAVTAAGDEWDEAKPHVDAGDDDYGWVSVAQAREDGILPVPWH